MKLAPATWSQDRDFWNRLWWLAVPIMGQQLLQAGLGAIDVLMVGQLGETAVAGLGLADQIFFLLILYLFGVASGSAIFAAQAWGRREMTRIYRVLGLGLVLGLGGAGLFSIGALIFPEDVIGFYTNDRTVIAVGADYLRYVGWSYAASAVVVYLFAFAGLWRVLDRAILRQRAEVADSDD